MAVNTSKVRWLATILATSTILFGIVAAAQRSTLRAIQQPYTGDSTLNGYHIGEYPSPEPEMPSAYARPNFLIEVTAKNQHDHVSSHFQLGQFLCKQSAQWPKYIALNDSLLDLLETIVALLNENGLETKTLHVMSGYRTPAYNAALGNVAFSRHIYGDAADVFVDADGDGFMDDLNRDGLLDVRDAQWLFNLIEEHQDDSFKGLEGGMSVYDTTKHHGPFIHVDTRGKRARWGRH